MAKKAAARTKQTPKDASSGIAARLKKPKDPPAWEPNATERAVGSYIKRRIGEMQDFRKSLNIEGRWKQADEEYVPHELDFGTTRKRFETDQDTGLRSRMVPVGDVTQQWRSATSAPTLLAKIQTAISIIVDQQPEAELTALLKKYTATTELAYSLWKRNWQITDAKEKLKLVIFNLVKYGWAPQRTFPRRIKYPKRVLAEKDPENPENDKYIETEIEWFNDIDREPLNPFTTWIDEMAKPYDSYSNQEDYFELDYSYDAFMVEFGIYPNSDFVPRDSAMNRAENTSDTNRQTVSRSQGVPAASKARQDIVTVGFFESRTKDLFAIYIPRHNITVYQAPMPNDDGYLSVTHTLWLLRSANLPYGVSLWEIIRQNKALYDKMKNMTMDQLVLSIMKFGFYAGTNTALGDGTIPIVPGQARQLTSSTGKPEVDWMEIPGPGMDAWKGLEALASMMDDDSGISPTLEGDITGKTLGEILHAKEAALKRLKVPVDNIAWLVEQDAYLTLSWMSQVYAIPNVMEFTTEQEMLDYEREEQITHHELFAQTDETTGEMTGITATYLPQLALHLEDRDGQLYQSRESRFFQVGKDIKPSQLKWRGIFKVIPRSLVDSSQELVKATKMEMFNMMVPLLQFPPQLVAKAVNQILKVNEEDAADWLPDAWVAYLNQANGQELPNIGTPGAEGAPAGSGGAPLPPGAPGAGGAPGAAPPGAEGPQMPVAGGPTIQGGTGMTPPQAATIVPGGPGPSISQLMGGKAKGLFGRGL